ncbi:hypothetical protein E9993_19120 [Labilibacter sediminis]|nr:hypothetical protein E9993_19120 [Labilibacter sediminis]
MIKYSILICVVLCFFSCSFKTKNNVVSVKNSRIKVNDEAYFIKGICYNPVPLGTDKRSFENIDEDLNLMKQAGINTIRVYVPIDDVSVLDKINSAGIKVIISFGYNQDGNYDILSATFIDYINKYKNHDAILFWELGNEYNYHPEWFENDITNWYKALNNAAKLVHENDPYHPVATAHGELPDSLALAYCKDLDIWGMNVYRWDDPEDIFKEWKAISDKPMYLSEAGADSYMNITKNGYQQGPNEKAQADASLHILNDVFKHKDICSGVTLFAFVDEWWKAGGLNTLDAGGFAPGSGGVPYDGTANEEYWGIVDINRRPKAAYHIVKEMYK